MFYRVWTFGDERVFRGLCGIERAEFYEHTPLLWVNAWMVGMTTSMILFASHLHQREGDEVSGKLSPCVRFGVDFCVADSTRRFRVLRVDRDVCLVRMVTLCRRGDDFYDLPLSESDAKLRVG